MPKALILIVDDEALVRDMLSEFFSQLGYLPLLAKNGKEALRLTQNLRPQLAVVDFRLPDMTGLEVVIQLRRVMTGLPAIIITAFSTPELESKATSLKVEIIRKPFNLPQLQALSKRLLKEWP